MPGELIETGATPPADLPTGPEIVPADEEVRPVTGSHALLRVSEGERQPAPQHQTPGPRQSLFTPAAETGPDTQTRIVTKPLITPSERPIEDRYHGIGGGCG